MYIKQALTAATYSIAAVAGNWTILVVIGVIDLDTGFALDGILLVLCEYSKFRIEWNSYFSIRFDLKRAQFKIWNTYSRQFLNYLTELRRFFTLATMPSNQQNQRTWSPTTPTTEPTIVLNNAVP